MIASCCCQPSPTLATRRSRRASTSRSTATRTTADLLIDGPFVPALANGAGEWRGSRNQRLIHHLARAGRSGRARLAAAPC